MKILITGGAGYIGSVLVPMLLRDDNNEVTVLDSFRHGTPSLLSVYHDRHLTIVRGDVRDATLLKNLVERADAVVHLAGIVGQRACAEDPALAEEINTKVTAGLVSFMRFDRPLIYPCTNSGYGMAGEAECDETTPLRPTSVYGRTKVAGEAHALKHEAAISLRFATLFGCSPRMRSDLMVNDFVWHAVSGVPLELFEGHFRRNFLHVRDAALAIVWALRNWRAYWGGAVFNVGDSRANMTKTALCGAILRHIPGFRWTGSAVGTDPDQRDYVVSNKKIEAVGWAPQHTLDDGIIELRKAYAMPFGSLGYRN